MTAIFLDNQTHERLLAALMEAAQDAIALNDPNPFRLALAEAAEIYPENVSAYWVPEGDFGEAA